LSPQEHLIIIRLALKAAADDGVRIIYSRDGDGESMSSDCEHDLTADQMNGSSLSAAEDPNSIKNIMAKYQDKK
jgi:hypothetical protein